MDRYFWITAVQLIGVIVWLIIEPPDTTEIHPYPLSAVLTCRVSTFSLMMSLVYNMFLILMCTLYAFKTRKIPENFNEAKYIGFTMYSTCIVWLAFVPIYFGSNNDYKVQIASMCMCINISASVALGCLFTPKVYLVLFQPYKNVRPGHTNTSALQSGNRGTYSMRFSGGRSQTMQSMTSCSRSSPPVSRPSQDEVKHANEYQARTHETTVEIYDDDEEERKLSTIQEVSESRDISSPSMFAENCRNRSRKSISSDSDQSGDPVRKNRMGTISCISDKVVCYKTEANIFPSEDQTFHVYSDSPTFSDFSS